MFLGESGFIYRDPAFPACPECGSPNVRLELRRRKGPRQRYICLERNCKSRGACEVEGSSGIERRRALILYYIVAVILAVWLIPALTGHMPN
jgi:hypothetical protein